MSQVLKGNDLYFETSSVTHCGRVRKNNEDSIFTSAERGVWVVADGMGGHKDGNVASGMIADAARALAQTGDSTDLLGRFRQEIIAVNEKLIGLSNLSHDLIVGSTLVALLMTDNNYSCLWAGDSRCYLARNNHISRLSHDHTEVQDLVDKGVISDAEARTWPRRNVITRAIGADYDVELDTVTGTAQNGDCFVLCSDGLTGHLEDREILVAVQKMRPKEACQSLLDTALERGGRDNISIIVVGVVSREATTLVQRRN